MATPDVLRQRHRRIDDARCLRDALRYDLTALGGDIHQLPGESELIARFGCSRNALREALNLLRNERLIERRQGAGTLVVGDSTLLMATENQGLRHDIVNGPARVHYQFLEVKEVAASGAVAQVLGLSNGEPVLVIPRLTIIDDEPALLWDTFVPRAVGRQLAASKSDGDFYELLRETLGIVVTDIRMRVEAVVADPSVSRLLQVDIGQPLLRFERVTCDRSGDFVALSFGRARADRVALLLHSFRDEATVGSGIVSRDLGVRLP